MKDYGQQRGKDNNTGNSTSSSSKPLASAIVVVGEASESEEEDYDDEEDYDEDEDYDDEEDEEEGEDDFVDAAAEEGEQEQGKGEEDIDHRVAATAAETIAGKYVDGKATERRQEDAHRSKQVTDSKSSLQPQRIGRSSYSATTATNRQTSEDDTSEHPNAGQRNRAGRRGRRRATSTTASAGQDKTLSDSTSMQSPKDGLNRDAAAASLKQASTKDSLLHSLLRESNASLKSHLLQLSCTPYANASKDVGRITRSLIVSQRGLQSAATTLQKTANDIHQLNQY